MVEQAEAPPPTLSGVLRLAVAWELKDLCYAAWSSEPSRAAKAAEALRRLCAAPPADAMTSSQRLEIEALADWTGGIACLTRGEMAEASASFDRAAGTFRALGDVQHVVFAQEKGDIYFVLRPPGSSDDVRPVIDDVRSVLRGTSGDQLLYTILGKGR